MSDWIQEQGETVREEHDTVIRRLMAEIDRLRALSYVEYLRTDWWQHKRKRAIKRAGGVTILLVVLYKCGCIKIIIGLDTRLCCPAHPTAETLRHNLCPSSEALICKRRMRSTSLITNDTLPHAHHRTFGDFLPASGGNGDA